MRKLVDMAMTPVEAKEKIAQTDAPAESAPKYSYGLCISLCQDDLNKLGMTDLPAVGDMMHAAIMAKVTSVSQRDTEGGVADSRVEFQITHMSVPEDENDEMVSERRAKRMYVGAKDDED